MVFWFAKLNKTAGFRFGFLNFASKNYYLFWETFQYFLLDFLVGLACLVSVLNQLVITTPTDHTYHDDHVQQQQQGNMLVLFETAAGYAIFKVCAPHVQYSTVQLSDYFFP